MSIHSNCQNKDLFFVVFYRFYSQQAHFNSFTARPVKEKKEICVSIKLEIYLHPSTTASIYPPDQHQQYVIIIFTIVFKKIMMLR